MPGIFVTGTSTGVGKTVTAAALTLAFDADYWKPVQAGIDPGPAGTDRERVIAWTGLPAERCWPEAYKLKMPASPHLASDAEGVYIDLDRLTPPPAPRALIVEGAGGVMVPLNHKQTMLDLMERLKMPVVVASSTALGTINHTLLTLMALRHRKIEIAGIIFNGEPDLGAVQTIQQMGMALILGRIPPMPLPTPASMRAMLADHLDLGPLRAALNR